MQFHKAERKKAKLRLAICGPSGSGKTFSALLIAKGIGGKVAMIDTESGSGELYADNPKIGIDYDVMQFSPPYSPQRAVEAVQAAYKAGYDVVIFDSLSHIWMGEGGMLEMVDNAAKGLQGNSFAAWKVVRPHEKKFLETLTRTDIHIIATMRTKTEWTTEKDARGKTRPVKVGLKPEQREGLEYEFTSVLDMSIDGNIASASKDRTDMFKGEYFTPTEETGRQLLAWLERGQESPPPYDIYQMLSAIANANTFDELRQIYLEHQDAAQADGKIQALNRATNNRKAELAAMQERTATEKPLSDAQLKMLREHYDSRGFTEEEQLSDMSSFQGRTIHSFEDLTTVEAHDFIEAINAERQEVAHAE